MRLTKIILRHSVYSGAKERYAEVSVFGRKSWLRYSRVGENLRNWLTSRSAIRSLESESTLGAEATAALKAMTREELEEKGERYEALLEQRALEEVLFG